MGSGISPYFVDCCVLSSINIASHIMNEGTGSKERPCFGKEAYLRKILHSKDAALCKVSWDVQ